MAAAGKKSTCDERKFQRASCDCPARFDWGTISNQARIMIISIGGCFLSTETLVPEGEEVELEFKFGDDAKTIECHCRVAWVAKKGIKTRQVGRQHGFALEFLRIYPEDRGLIDEYVTKQNRLFKSIEHELKKKKPDKEQVKDWFASVRPGESTHLNHIKKVCREELLYFRLRK